MNSALTDVLSNKLHVSGFNLKKISCSRKRSNMKSGALWLIGGGFTKSFIHLDLLISIVIWLDVTRLIALGTGFEHQKQSFSLHKLIYRYFWIHITPLFDGVPFRLLLGVSLRQITSFSNHHRLWNYLLLLNVLTYHFCNCLADIRKYNFGVFTKLTFCVIHEIHLTNLIINNSFMNVIITSANVVTTDHIDFI